MKTLAIVVALVGLVSLGANGAHAGTCTIGGTTYTCELNCTGTGSCNADIVGFTACDATGGGGPGNGDGFCTICGDGANNTIIGTTGADIICGKSGNDNIMGDPTQTGPGAGDKISGEGGNDTLNGRAGDDLVLGGTGDDNLRGGNGDDEIDGGTGDDDLSGEKNSDTLRGGDGVDIIIGGEAPFFATELGDTMCGGAGDDFLSVVADGSHCLDGGPDQTDQHGELGYDCYYIGPQFEDGGDNATWRNCAAAYPPDEFHSSQRSCNCLD